MKFPDDPVAGEMLMPAVVLTAERFAQLNFDPNAGVLLALDAVR